MEVENLEDNLTQERFSKEQLQAQLKAANAAHQERKAFLGELLRALADAGDAAEADVRAPLKV